MSHQIKPEDANDVRVSLTTRIWIFATIMLAISTPGFTTPSSLANIGHVIIDLAILAAAGFSTAAVWGAFDGRGRGVLPPAAGDTSDLKRLEERLSNLEMIGAYERLIQSEEGRSSLPPHLVRPEPSEEATRKVKLSLR